ncbi:hypothetical protein BU15DRAFT_64974 [Melanogaster broomeanus]|nr:hypothetical protein BU15DRAFT_64974 [Melanogaster broomeanus]
MSDNAQSERDQELHWAPVACGSAKADPSDRVTNPADDVAPTVDGKGCIALDTVQDRDAFVCPNCYPSLPENVRHHTGNPFGFCGYNLGGRKKENWPLLLVTLQLKTKGENFLHAALALSLLQEYHCNASNYGQHDGQPAYSSIIDLLTSFLGRRFLDSVAKGNAMSNRRVTALFLCSGGPTVRSPKHFQELKDLFETGTFHSIIAFSSSSVLSAYVNQFICAAIIETTSVPSKDVWLGVVDAMLNNLGLARCTAIVVIFTSPDSKRILSQQIALQTHPFCPLGVMLRSCGNPGCEPGAGLVTGKYYEDNLVIDCQICPWTSRKIPLEEVRKYVHLLLDDPDLVLAWHEFPPPAALHALLTS